MKLINNVLKKNRFYSIIAWLSDFYFTALILGAFAAFGFGLFQVIMPLTIGIIIVILTILLPSVYYTFLISQTRWLTPGELIVGRKIESGQKVWTNPYGYNRWALFLVILLTLMIVGNTWDRLSEGYVYTLLEVGMRVVFLTLVSYGLVELGLGRARSVVFPAGYFVFQAFQTTRMTFPGASRTELESFGLILLGFAGLLFVVAGIYGYLQSRLSKRKQLY